MSSLAAANVQLFVVYYSRVPCAASRRWAVELGLGPGRCLEVKDDDIVEVQAVLVLSAKDEKLISLPEVGRMSCSTLGSRSFQNTIQTGLPMRTPGISP